MEQEKIIRYENKMWCPICEKAYTKDAMILGGLIQDEEGRLILPCEIHTAKERQKSWKEKNN